MKLPIDTTGVTFLCALAPEPVMDFETKRQKGDVNGEPLFSVQLVLLADGGAEVISVKIVGMPADGLVSGTPVAVVGLVATPWSMGDRSGVSFKASSIQPLTPAASGRTATPASSGSAAADKAA